MTRKETTASLTLPDANEAHDLLREMASRSPAFRSRKVDKPLSLYGAGDMGQMAASYFKALNLPFRYVVDQQADRYRDHPAWKGISVLKPADVPESHRSECLLAVCIATACYTDIAAALAFQGWSDIVPFYDITEAYVGRYPIRNGWFAGKLDANDIQEIGAGLANWAYDTSRAHHLQFIAWHLLREDLFFPDAPVNTQNRYFIPEIMGALREDEVFLDGGAHHGEVTLRFSELMKDRFKKIYVVEPDPANMQLCSEIIKRRPEPFSRAIEMVEIALGKESGKVTFIGGLGYASQFDPNGRSVVTVETIDGLNLPATFLKLHLEGWEHDALLGGLKTLRQNRPLLAITTYHNRNGLWRVFSLLTKELTGYVFLLRLHAWMGTGCVVYAFPHERFKKAELDITDTSGIVRS